MYGDILGKLNFQGLGQVSESNITTPDNFEGEPIVETSGPIIPPPVTIVNVADAAATEAAATAASTPPPTTTTTTTEGGGY